MYAKRPQVQERLTTQVADALQRILTPADPDAGDRIPCCPDWTRDDLVTHTTSVYRWVELIVRGARNRPPALPEPESDPLADPVKALSAAHHDVLEALRAAPADLDCWTMWPAAESRLHWARRMVHETVVHAVDARNAGRESGESGSGLDQTLAAGGVDTRRSSAADLPHWTQR